MSLNGDRQAGAGSRSGAGESGGCSTRNDVVASPARRTGWRDEPSQEREVGGHPADFGLTQGGCESVERLGAGGPVRDQLGDHRVVGEPDLVTLLDSGVDADAAGQPQHVDAPGLREERPRVLGVQPDLDRVPARVGPHVELFPGGDPELCLHDVDAGDELRDRMLDLDPAVELQEPEVAAVDHELRRAGIRIADGAREGDCGLAHLRPQRVVNRRRR